MATDDFASSFPESSEEAIAMESLPDSPSSMHPLDFGLDLDSFLLQPPSPPASQPNLIPIAPFSAPLPPPSPSPSSHALPSRAHPPSRHRRRLFGNSPSPSPSAHRSSVSIPHQNGADDEEGIRARKASEFDDMDPPKQQKTLQGEISTSKKRGNYNCGKCGKPKRGHICTVDEAPSNSAIKPAIPASRSPQKQTERHIHPFHKENCSFEDRNSLSAEFLQTLSPSTVDRRHGSARSLMMKSCVNLPPSPSVITAIAPAVSSSATSSCSTNERFQRAQSENVQASAIASYTTLSSDSYVPEVCVQQQEEEEEVEAKAEAEDESMPLSCMVQILSRLHPMDLSSAGTVCRRWRQCAEYAWLEIHQVQLNISSSRKPIGVEELHSEEFLPFVLRKCPNLHELTLLVSSGIRDNMLKYIVSLSPQLSSLEIGMAPDGVNSITGEGLRDLLRHCRDLKSLKLEGCRNMLEIELNSTCLETLWLTGCSELKYMFLNCPNLSELSLDFLPYGDQMSHIKIDNLTAIMKNVGNTAKELKRLHVASHLLDDRVVHALLSTGLRSLSMLSLTFGRGITDTSVATIVTNCQRLELLDLSGSSITDKALQMISYSFSLTLTKLLLALCPNISHFGLEMVVSQLPRLQLLDCGKVIVDNWNGMNQASTDANDHVDHDDEHDVRHRKSGVCVLQLYHLELEKLSLWGCSGLQELILDCPKLVDLNLTSCSKLRPDGFQLHCPSLKEVHVGKCRKECVDKIQYQMDHALFDPRVIWRRQADGSKRVQAPCLAEEPSICSTP